MKKLLLLGISFISCCQFLEAQKITSQQSEETGIQIHLEEYAFSHKMSFRKAFSKFDFTYLSNTETVGGNGSAKASLNTADLNSVNNVAETASKFIYSNESGALDEGFNNIFEVCSESIQENISTDQKSFVLNFISNPNANNQPDTYKGIFWYAGKEDNGGVHTNSGVLNYWFYLLSAGGNGFNDKAYKYAVSGIGISKAQAIAYRTLTKYLQPYAQYKDARIYSIRSAEELYGQGSNEVLQTISAWNAVGVDSTTNKQSAVSAYASPEENNPAKVNSVTPCKISFDQQSNQLSFEINDKISVLRTIAVCNSDQKLIFTNDIKTVQGNNRLQINLPSLADGNYVLKVDNVHSEIFSVKH